MRIVRTGKICGGNINIMKIVLLAPFKNSIYSRLICWYLANDKRFELTDVITRTPWTKKRISSELKRDGHRLITKVYEKMILGDARFSQGETDTIYTKARAVNLPDGNLVKLAQILNYNYYQVNDHNEPRCQEIIEEAAPTVIVFTGGGMIRQNILAIPKLGILNCHLGILPKYRGMDVVEWPAVENALDKEGLGLTLHYMNEGLDTGPILLHRRIELKKKDSFKSIRKRLESLMADLVYEGLQLLIENKIDIMEQQMNAGRQYFVMHQRMKEYAQKQLRKYLDTKEM
jgi:methionyl-tRNA formyltransferase